MASINENVGKSESRSSDLSKCHLMAHRYSPLTGTFENVPIHLQILLLMISVTLEIVTRIFLKKTEEMLQ